MSDASKSVTPMVIAVAGTVTAHPGTSPAPATMNTISSSMQIAMASDGEGSSRT